MEVIDPRRSTRVPVPDASHVGAARRTAVALAERMGLDETARGAVALVVSEAATNLAKHAGQGELLLRALRPEEGGGVEMLAIDRGPGIRDVAGALRDGFSTAGTRGHGLGAMQRMASRFDLFSRAGGGTVVLVHVGGRDGQPPPRPGLPEFGVVCVAKPGESVPGDDWAVSAIPGDGALLMVADGLGHGPLAADASRAAVETLQAAGGLRTPVDVITRAHARLRATRGAAMAVAELGSAAGTVRYAGVGNIAGHIVSPAATQSMVSHNGIVGHEMRKVQSFDYAAPAGALVVLHSDGLTSQWRLDAYPGLAQRHASVVAAVLYRDFTRGRDDVTVLVARIAGAPA